MELLIRIVAWTDIVLFVLGFICTPLLFGREYTRTYGWIYWIFKFWVFGSLAMLLPLRALGYI